MEQGAARTPLNVLLILTLVLAAGTLIQDFRFDNSLARTREAALTLDHQIGSVEVGLSDFRAAETGYLATGQGPDFWMRRAAELADQIDTGLSRLRATSPSPQARAKYDAAAGSLTDLLGIDKRARTDVQNDQRFLASDLVFVDGLDASQRLSGELSAARTIETAEADAHLAWISHARLGMNGIAIGILAMVAIYAVRGRHVRQPTVSAAAEVAQMLRELPPAVKPAAPAVMRPIPTAVSINLPDMADLCVDLARVMDDRDVPALLERTAKILEAKGVIVWVADKSGLTLRPAVTHGYPERVLARLGALQVAADNVTSLSFRSARAQAMNGAAPGAPGAIAVPLMTATGCAGVLAAETRDSKPAAETIALAKIIAAQFATLIAPSEMEEVRAAQA